MKDKLVKPCLLHLFYCHEGMNYELSFRLTCLNVLSLYRFLPLMRRGWRGGKGFTPLLHKTSIYSHWKWQKCWSQKYYGTMHIPYRRWSQVITHCESMLLLGRTVAFLHNTACNSSGTKWGSCCTPGGYTEPNGDGN